VLRRILTVLPLATIAIAMRASAQCPNGAPPPCAVGATARPNQPLDPQTWIVAPFTNITRATDLDWLSDASVTLLATDMSRWSDLRVVDAERVTDLLRGTPEATRTRLGLEAGLDMAKRAGAGKLVMGEFFRTGARTTVTARVFDVRTGTRLRQLIDAAPVADSIPGTYQRLASRVVDAPAPQGTTLTGVGTSSIEAMRAYTLGMQASTRWRQDSANLFFRRAVERDSTFALALLRLGPATYESAVRHSANLPERERILIALGAPNLTRAIRCNYADRLLVRDSMDAEGWHARGMCLLPDLLASVPVVIGADGRGVPGARINAARAAFERALRLQPIRSAMVRLMNLTWFPGVTSCTSLRSPCPADSTYIAPLILEADTLALHFERAHPFENPVTHRKSLAGRRAMLTRARDYIARWVSEYPDNLGGHLYYGYYSGLLGDLDVASRELRIAQSVVWGRDSVANRARILGYRITIELRRGHADSAAILVDSANHAEVESDEINFGRIDRVARRDTSRGRPATEAVHLALAGIVSPDVERVIALTVDSALRNDRLKTVRLFGFHARRTRPASDTASPSAIVRFQAFLALGDTVRARRALDEYDAWGADRAQDAWTGYEMLAAESRLQLGDTATAWQRIEPLRQRLPGYAFAQGTYAIGRALLLYADLAAATGHPAEARFGYRMVVGMWAKADPAFQPAVARARAALARLGGG
jgi:TolB-like protein